MRSRKTRSSKSKNLQFIVTQLTNSPQSLVINPRITFRLFASRRHLTKVFIANKCRQKLQFNTRKTNFRRRSQLVTQLCEIPKKNSHSRNWTFPTPIVSLTIPRIWFPRNCRVFRQNGSWLPLFFKLELIELVPIKQRIVLSCWQQFSAFIIVLYRSAIFGSISNGKIALFGSSTRVCCFIFGFCRAFLIFQTHETSKLRSKTLRDHWYSQMDRKWSRKIDNYRSVLIWFPSETWFMCRMRTTNWTEYRRRLGH